MTCVTLPRVACNLQINCVAMRGVNEDEVLDFVALTEKKVFVHFSDFFIISKQIYSKNVCLASVIICKSNWVSIHSGLEFIQSDVCLQII